MWLFIHQARYQKSPSDFEILIIEKLQNAKPPNFKLLLVWEFFHLNFRILEIEITFNYALNLLQIQYLYLN